MTARLVPTVDFLFARAGAAIACAGVLGLIVGSFLNVVILRLPARLMHAWRTQSREMLELAPSTDDAAPPGIVREPSHCPHCKHPLGAIENIPLLSWLALRGRCRHCHAPISIQYPLVELLTGVCSAIVVWKFGLGWQAGAGLVLTWTLITLAGIDMRTQLLPDQMTLPLLWLGLAQALVPLFVDTHASIVGAVVGYLSLWSVYWLFKLATGKEGMGYGDFKLLAALGAWMGPFALLPIVLLSSLIGAIVGGAFLALRGHDRATPIPFGPFIAAAGWAWFVFGTELSLVYLSLFSLR
ncbi:MAG: prepilin peptidase [Xanthomonadaceae bacterium]|nr:A24 family peptidase [Xanthomonadaceae bacterium]MDE1885526.1 prepilin peptidase [Xanthomonadaceae bacterium]MDE1961629.1 prepilin peptidase [Xanthomonadaceae bacterium]MDE2084293.1 prepilin peptidase [Xanthomonadaceae bacterium]